MIDIVQIFITHVGITLFIGGIICCFVAVTFRYGVFCTLLGNLLFCLAIIFPKQAVEFIETYQLTELFNVVDIEMLKVKAVVTGVIIMGALWVLRWIKHVITEGIVAFIFPSLYQPQIKEVKDK